ncbi:hypothetical protein BVRB_9g207540 [Beta vulgaris subsp. vulgaris]|nr:hypothetical protein BVRB_9g207540 [Beta vulgaris subsp. vulgaris]
MWGNVKFINDLPTNFDPSYLKGLINSLGYNNIVKLHYCDPLKELHKGIRFLGYDGTTFGMFISLLYEFKMLDIFTEHDEGEVECLTQETVVSNTCKDVIVGNMVCEPLSHYSSGSDDIDYDEEGSDTEDDEVREAREQLQEDKRREKSYEEEIDSLSRLAARKCVHNGDSDYEGESSDFDSPHNSDGEDSTPEDQNYETHFQNFQTMPYSDTDKYNENPLLVHDYTTYFLSPHSLFLPPPPPPSSLNFIDPTSSDFSTLPDLFSVENLTHSPSPPLPLLKDDYSEISNDKKPLKKSDISEEVYSPLSFLSFLIAPPIHNIPENKNYETHFKNILTMPYSEDDKYNNFLYRHLSPPSSDFIIPTSSDFSTTLLPNFPPSKDDYSLHSILENFKTTKEDKKKKLQKRRSMRQRKISEKVYCLGMLLPGGYRHRNNTADMLEEAVKYIKFLEAQVNALWCMPTESRIGELRDDGRDVYSSVVGELVKLSRPELLQVVVNSPVAQKVMADNQWCLYSIEQMELLKRMEARQKVIHQFMNNLPL